MAAATTKYGDRYQVIGRVGSGGMAEVYRARDELLGRDVAVKVLSERFATDQSFVERFRREAQAAANLNHPNIVSLYDYGAAGGTYFIVMEFIDGKTLSDVIEHEGPLMPERAAEVASDVAAGLGRAHAQGVVHRDIKSSNIMLTSSGQTKVTDFGIARALGGTGEQTMTQTGMVIGTASYLSPEQAQGNPVDARSDVYSLGVVLYEMLAGQTPFAGDTPLAIAYKHVREDPQPPSALNPDVPHDLDAVVLKAMAKNPDNRYSSAAEMREDLQRFLSGRHVQATPLIAGTTAVAAPVTGTQVMDETDYGDEYAYEPEQRRRTGLYILVTLIVLGLIALLVWFLAGGLFSGEPVTVPDVVGKTESRARDILEDAGLDSSVERRFDEAPEGEVIEQNPRAGDTVEEGDEVTLIVSRGSRQGSVPDLSGMTVEEAQKELEKADLTLGEVTQEPNDEFEEGQIFAQDPAAGQEVDEGTSVDVRVSGGPEPVLVPSVIGQTEDQARSNLEALGLEVEVESAPNDEFPEGEVFAQDPTGGSEARPGDTVRIAVSEGPEQQEMPDVIGQDADEAEALLESDYGLEVDQEPFAGACAQPPGTVCDQDPDPGTAVEPGDSAVLFVQAGGAFTPGSTAGLLAIVPARVV